MTTTAQQVAKWAKAARHAIETRDRAIRDMRAEGAPLRAIAAVAGLSHTAVAKICSSQQS